jgi:hypothetical protein
MQLIIIESSPVSLLPPLMSKYSLSTLFSNTLNLWWGLGEEISCYEICTGPQTTVNARVKWKGSSAALLLFLLHDSLSAAVNRSGSQPYFN